MCTELFRLACNPALASCRLQCDTHIHTHILTSLLTSMSHFAGKYARIGPLSASITGDTSLPLYIPLSHFQGLVTWASAGAMQPPTTSTCVNTLPPCASRGWVCVLIGVPLGTHLREIPAICTGFQSARETNHSQRVTIEKKRALKCGAIVA